MNLNQLWVGSDYAYFYMRGRGEQFRWDAQRVRIIRPFQKQELGNQRLSGFADVQYLTHEGEIQKNYKDEPKKGEVRARDIAMRWDEYEDEFHHRKAERDRIEEEHRIERERAQQQREERARLKELRDNAVRNKLVECGIPREAISSVSDYNIVLSRDGIEHHFGLGVDKVA